MQKQKRTANSTNMNSAFATIDQASFEPRSSAPLKARQEFGSKSFPQVGWRFPLIEDRLADLRGPLPVLEADDEGQADVAGVGQLGLGEALRLSLGSDGGAYFLDCRDKLSLEGIQEELELEVTYPRYFR